MSIDKKVLKEILGKIAGQETEVFGEPIPLNRAAIAAHRDFEKIKELADQQVKGLQALAEVAHKQWSAAIERAHPELRDKEWKVDADQLSVQLRKQITAPSMPDLSGIVGGGTARVGVALMNPKTGDVHVLGETTVNTDGDTAQDEKGPVKH